MRIIEIKHIDNCFDGTVIKELLFSSVIKKELIFKLGKEEEIQYFAHFERPFFKVSVKGLYDLKGIEGNKTMRIHLKQPQKYTIEMFCELLKSLSKK